MRFFKWYGRLHRKMLPCFTHFFVQNTESKKSLDELGFPNSTVAGDTRFHRVIEIAEKWEPVNIIEKFIAGDKAIVAGSTWREDEIVLVKAFAAINDTSLKLIIAPHEVNEKHLGELKKLFPDSIRFAELPDSNSLLATCLIVDNIGMLSRLYKYGDITYVGGGLTSYGVHNVLEAAVYNKPVIIGPYYEKYIEATGLVDCGGAAVIKDETQLADCITGLLKNSDDSYTRASGASENYVRQNAGATKTILQFI